MDALMTTFSEWLLHYLTINTWHDQDEAIEDLRSNGMTEYAARVAVTDNAMFMKFRQEEIHE